LDESVSGDRDARQCKIYRLGESRVASFGGLWRSMSETPSEEKVTGDQTEAPEVEKGYVTLLAELQKKNQQLSTSLKYLQADFENYRKRAEKEMKEVEVFAASRLVTKLLSVLDELELAISNAQSSQDSTLLDGIKMVYKGLSSVLEKEGLQRIEAVGKPFDPDLHEAVETVAGDPGGEATVVEEIRKGFLFKNQVIRPSMVKVKLVSPAVHE